MKKVTAFALIIFFAFACDRQVYFEPPILTLIDSLDYEQTPYVLEIPEALPPQPPLGIELTVEGVELGKRLFYDPILSSDGTQSCASCHNQSLAFTDNGLQYSVGVDGISGTKNSMALFNLAYYDKFFWNGRSPNLPHQALLPVTDPVEMHNTWTNAIEKIKADPTYTDMFFKAYDFAVIDSSLVADAITQFELTLLSGDSKFDKFRKFETQLTPQEFLGFEIFNREPRSASSPLPGGDCFHCHGAPLFTNLEFMNNGLDVNLKLGLEEVTGDPFDKGKFKVPSLRNIEKTAPYMHDGRFKTLEEVVEHYNSGVKITSTLAPIMLKADINGNPTGIANGLFLTDNEKAALVAFLKTLTDDDFLTNPNFAEPYN